LSKIGLPPTLLLEHHTQHDSKADFDRFKSKDSPHRIALLVNRGVEGWNVPALFACALARKLKSSNNFVLQAASRCLRQIPGNPHKARVYLSIENRGVLDKQLQETYGESFAELLGGQSRSRQAVITLRKVDIPPLVVRKTVRRLERLEKQEQPICLERPRVAADQGKVVAYTPSESGKLMPAREVAELYDADTFDLYGAAQELGRIYRLAPFDLLDELRKVYGQSNEMPVSHLPELARQIEAQTSPYRTVEETVEVALALVKVDGFEIDTDAQGSETYTAEISYPIDREHLLIHYEAWQKQAGSYGFHYTPYNFDSTPEKNFFEVLLEMLKQNPEDVEDIYFTGALTDTRKTDFYIEYRGVDGRMHNYTPDFVVRRKDGKCLIVEIKSERQRGHEIDGEDGRKAIATRAWTDLNPERLKYQMIFTSHEYIEQGDALEARKFIEGK